jgi:hypothetical protein
LLKERLVLSPLFFGFDFFRLVFFYNLPIQIKGLGGDFVVGGINQFYAVAILLSNRNKSFYLKGFVYHMHFQNLVPHKSPLKIELAQKCMCILITIKDLLSVSGSGGNPINKGCSGICAGVIGGIISFP